MKSLIHKSYCQINPVGMEGSDLWIMCPLCNLAKEDCEFFGGEIEKKVLPLADGRQIVALRNQMCLGSLGYIIIEVDEG
jgi:hypothetical protein